MSDQDMGKPFAKVGEPLVERSRRDYEVIVAVNPGASYDGVSLAVVNPDGTAEYVHGRTKWKNIQHHLKKVDYFIACYWTAAEEGRCHELALDAQKLGCVVSVEHATFHGLEEQWRVPTRYERASKVIKRLLNPRGISPEFKGFYRDNQFLRFIPRFGEKL